MKIKTKTHPINLPKYLYLTVLTAIFLLSSCSTIETKFPIPTPSAKPAKINDRLTQLSKINNIKMKGHINITHPQKNGNLFARFEYNTIDSLRIQFKDLIGRKIALLRMNNDRYHLWLQRKGEHLRGEKLPTDYSYLTISNQLTISELRKILLGLPLSREYHQTLEDSSNNIINYVSANKLNAKYKVDEKQNYIKRINLYENKELVGKILYKKYILNCDSLITSHSIIENNQNPFKIEINLSNFNYAVLASS